MHKSGFISILGRPNVGKSSLLNFILKEKVSIVVNKPQTTRNEIKGIYNDENHQLIFLDTPGFHKSKNELDKFMNFRALNALRGADIVLFLSPADDWKLHSLDKQLIDIIQHRKINAWILITKSDKVSKNVIEKRIAEIKKIHNFEKVFITSIKDGSGINELIEEIKINIPAQPPFYDKEQLTDYSNAFSIAEIIREKALLVLHEEVPHSLGVMIEEKEYNAEEGIFVIKAAIVIERDSQKGIVIGKGGEKLKEIGSLARKELLEIYDSRIYLELFVKVEHNWRKNLFKVQEMGYKK